MALSLCQRNRFARAPALAPLTITDAALEALVVALTQRHGRLDTAQYIGDWTPPQQQRAHMIAALARTLQTLLAEYDTGVLEELMADSGPL